jgi:hypothetical protein
MLNVLIAIISDYFATVLARKQQEAIKQRAITVVDLESVYLGGYFSTQVSMHQVQSINSMHQVQSINSMHQVQSNNSMHQVQSINSMHQVQ